jgi:hypothetical protein
MIRPGHPFFGPDPSVGQLPPEEESFLSSKNWIMVLIGAGVVLRLAQYLANRSLWLDEAYLALNIVNRSFVDLLQPLDYNQGAPIGFLMVEKAAILALGNNEYALRLFPLLAGISSMFLFTMLASQYLRAKAVPIALGLFAVLTPLIWYSSEVKQYSCDVAIATLLYLVTLETMRNDLSAARAVLIGFIGGTSIWFSHPALFLLAGTGTTLLSRFLARKEWKKVGFLLVSFSIWGASFATLYFVSLRHLVINQGLLTYWDVGFAPFPPRSLREIKWYIDAFFNIFNDPTGIYFSGIAAFAFLVGFMTIYSEKYENAFLLSSPIVFALAASILHKYPFNGRLMLFAVPAVLFFIAAGTERIIEKLHQLSATVGYIFLGLLLLHPFCFAGYHLVHPQEREEIKPVMSYVMANRRPGDILYLYSASVPAFRYYSERYGFRESDCIVGKKARDNWKIYDNDLDKLRGHNRVWVLFSHVRKGSGVDEEKYFLKHLSSIGKRLDAMKKNGAAVYLYDLGKNHATNETQPSHR